MKRALALVMAALLTSGCGVVFVEGPHVVEGKVTCTQEMALPLVDAAVAAVAITSPFIYEAARNRSTMDPQIGISVAMWGVGLATAISAVIGIKKVQRCRRTVAAPMP